MTTIRRIGGAAGVQQQKEVVGEKPTTTDAKPPSSTFDTTPASTPKPLEYHHDPLYDELTADKQLTKQQHAEGIVTEWNGLNQVKVAETRRPTTVDEVRQALADATKKGQRISLSGARHSSGSQSISPNSLHLDMTQM